MSPFSRKKCTVEKPACPKPNSTICCPSSMTFTRQPSNTRMKTGSHPAREGVNLAVVPKGNCQQWRINCSLSSILGFYHLSSFQCSDLGCWVYYENTLP